MVPKVKVISRCMTVTKHFLVMFEMLKKYFSDIKSGLEYASLN